jgi:hypothetical protein
MELTGPPHDAEPSLESRCRGCSAWLVPDQRYCLQCGARRGPLPRRIAESIAAGLERGQPISGRDAPGVGGVALGDDSAPAGPRRRYGGLFGPASPGPRQAAFAVLGVLAFGVFLGSFGPTSGIASFARGPLLVLLPHSSNSSPSQSGSGGGGGGGGGSSGGSGSGQQSQQSQSDSGSTGGTSTGGGASGGGGFPNYNNLPPIPYFFLVALSGEGFSQTFGPIATNSYFRTALPKQGELLVNYYSVAGGPLANEIALVSGQGPTPQTVQDCPKYTKLAPGTKGAHSQALGKGCVYPADTKTLPAQFVASHRTWKAYVQGIGSGSGDADACEHPKLGAGAGKGPTPKQPYAAWTNPFVYFASITGAKDCKQDDVGLGQLKTDLASASTTPAFSYIVPSPCDDGAATPCAPHARAGLGQAERFLKPILAEIEASPAYKDGGMIAITFDNAPQTGPDADPSSCCSTPKFPNLPPASSSSAAALAADAPTTSSTTTSSSTTTVVTSTTETPTSIGTTTTTSTTTGLPTTTTTSTTTTPPSDGLTSPTGGGGQVGALLISPWVKPGSEDLLNYFNHFSLLASIESLFGFGHIGYAGVLGVPTVPVGDFNGSGPS